MNHDISSRSAKAIIDSCEILKFSTQAYCAGQFSAYRPISVELRKLLCDADPLFTRLYPRQHLHPIVNYLWNNNYRPAKGEAHIPIQVPLTFNVYSIPLAWLPKGHAISTGLLFRKTEETYSVADWLEQPYYTHHCTIRKLIESTADKEGAHADTNYRRDRSLLPEIELNGEDPCVLGIAAIGIYIQRILERLLSQELVLNQHMTLALSRKYKDVRDNCVRLPIPGMRLAFDPNQPNRNSLKIRQGPKKWTTALQFRHLFGGKQKTIPIGVQHLGFCFYPVDIATVNVVPEATDVQSAKSNVSLKRGISEIRF